MMTSERENRSNNQTIFNTFDVAKRKRNERKSEKNNNMMKEEEKEKEAIF